MTLKNVTEYTCIHIHPSVQFSSVAQSGLTLCDPVNCSTTGLPVHHQLPKFTQTHVHWVGDAIPATSSSVVPFSSCPQSLPASESFPMGQLFAWGGQSIGVWALTSVLAKNTHDWSPLEWTSGSPCYFWLRSQWAQVKVSAGLLSFLAALGENLLPCLF